MFRWYQNSSICYAYLHDYESETFEASRFKESDLFTRGWTLQELIAPRKVDFYNRDWRYIGAKDDNTMCSAIREITNIDIEILLGSDIESASIAKRMSWASKRKTTRPEDEAYCLLGIFGINMSLLYGEASQAFIRLQRKIMKKYPDDHSLYAWGTPTEKCPIEAHVSSETTTQELRDIAERQPGRAEPLFGLLATSPKLFKDSRNYSPVSWASYLYIQRWEDEVPAYHPAVFGQGVRIGLPLSNRTPFYYRFKELPVSQVRYGSYAILLCKDDIDESLSLFVPLLQWGPGYWARTGDIYRYHHHLKLSEQLQHTVNEIKSTTYTLTIFPEKKIQLKNGDVILRSVLDLRTLGSSIAANLGNTSTFIVNSSQRVSADWDQTIRVKGNLINRYYSRLLKDVSGNWEPWSLILGRDKVESLDQPAFQAGIIVYTPGMDPFGAPFTLERIFQSPSDEHTFDMMPYSITIGVERRDLPNGSGFVNIVDMIIRNRPVHENSSIPFGQPS